MPGIDQGTEERNGVMHARMARYTFIGDPQDLARKAEAGMLPLFEAEPGQGLLDYVEPGRDHLVLDLGHRGAG